MAEQAPPGRFEFMPGTGERPPVVRAAGDIDMANADQFQAVLTEAAAVAGEVTADMTAVTYCDSAAIRVLFTAAGQAKLTLVILEDGPIATLLKVAALDQVTTVVTSG